MTDHPATVDGIRWITPGVDDAARLADLYADWAESTGQTWRETEEEIAHDMQSPATDLDDYRCAEDDQGRLVAGVMTHIRSAANRKHRAFLFTVSRPGYEQAEIEGLRWGEARARDRFDAAEDDLERVIRVFSDIRDEARIGRFEAEGFEKVRYFVDMIRPLAEPIPPVELPNDVEIVDWSDDWIERTWKTHCEAFADHWGSLPPTLDEWRHRFERPHFRTDLSCVAAAGDIAASYSLNGVYPEDWPTRGRREGWIETLGTRRTWRRKGLATALITESMHRFEAAGLDHAALDVDSGNPTGAFGLYERLGFVAIDTTVDLMKAITPNTDSRRS